MPHQQSLPFCGVRPRGRVSETASAALAKRHKFFCNNISKVGESEAAMHTLSNYCCGPGTALPKSCSNNGGATHAYKEKAKHTIRAGHIFWEGGVKDCK